MNVTLNNFGDLRCRVVSDSNTTAERLLILCHGFGAPGHDLVDLAAALCHLDPSLSSKVAFIFPEAPLELDFPGFGEARAWWYLDLEAIERAQRTGIARSLAKERPEGLAQAQTLLGDALTEILNHFNLGIEDTILGGFSQGAMLTTDLAIHQERAPKALIVFSGNLLNDERSLPKIAEQKNLDVFISHGRQDPILPFSGAKDLETAFLQGGSKVEFLPFDGGHTIPRGAIERLAEKLSE